MLRIVVGMDVARVATLMDRTPGSVRVLCHRGLQAARAAPARARQGATATVGVRARAGRRGRRTPPVAHGSSGSMREDPMIRRLADRAEGTATSSPCPTSTAVGWPTCSPRRRVPPRTTSCGASSQPAPPSGPWPRRGRGPAGASAAPEARPSWPPPRWPPCWSPPPGWPRPRCCPGPPVVPSTGILGSVGVDVGPPSTPAAPGRARPGWVGRRERPALHPAGHVHVGCSTGGSGAGSSAAGSSSCALTEPPPAGPTPWSRRCIRAGRDPFGPGARGARAATAPVRGRERSGTGGGNGGAPSTPTTTLPGGGTSRGGNTGWGSGGAGAAGPPHDHHRPDHHHDRSVVGRSGLRPPPRPGGSSTGSDTTTTTTSP